MVKLLGSLLILGGGFWARWSMVSVCRRGVDTLSGIDGVSYGNGGGDPRWPGHRCRSCWTG